MESELNSKSEKCNRQEQLFGSRYNNDLSSLIKNVIESTISFSGSYKDSVPISLNFFKKDHV